MPTLSMPGTWAATSAPIEASRPIDGIRAFRRGRGALAGRERAPVVAVVLDDRPLRCWYRRGRGPGGARPRHGSSRRSRRGQPARAVIPTIARQYRQSMTAGGGASLGRDGRAARPADHDPRRLHRLGGDGPPRPAGRGRPAARRGGARRRRDAGPRRRGPPSSSPATSSTAGPTRWASCGGSAGLRCAGGRGRAASSRCSRATTRCRCSAGWPACPSCSAR